MPWRLRVSLRINMRRIRDKREKKPTTSPSPKRKEHCRLVRTSSSLILPGLQFMAAATMVWRSCARCWLGIAAPRERGWSSVGKTVVVCLVRGQRSAAAARRWASALGVTVDTRSLGPRQIAEIGPNPIWLGPLISVCSRYVCPSGIPNPGHTQWAGLVGRGLPLVKRKRKGWFYILRCSTKKTSKIKKKLLLLKKLLFW